MISIAGVGGLLAGVGIILVVQPDGSEDLIAIPTVTSALGLALGAAWTRKYDERNPPPDDFPGDAPF